MAISFEPTDADIMGLLQQGQPRDVASMLPAGWSGFNESQKLQWFNENQVTPQELLNAGVDQQTINTMSQRGYTGGAATAPVPAPAPAAAPAAVPAVSPMAGFDASQGVQRIGGMLYQPIFDDFGNLQEVLRYQEGQTGAGQSYDRLDPTTLQPTGTGQFQRTAGLGSMLRQTVQDLGPLALAAISLNPALAASIGTAVANAVGVETLTASQAAALGKTIASTAVQAVTTGQLNVEDALRSAAVTAFAPSIGKSVSDTVADAFYNATGADLPDAVIRSVNNAAASAAATAIQQGADSSDIGRNALAGAISSGVTGALNEAKIDPSLALAIGRTTGSYISTGDITKSVMDGVTRGISYEQQKAEADKAKEVRAAYRDPTRALDVLQSGQTTDVTSPVAADVQAGGVPADQQVQITGQTATPTLDQQVLDVIQGQQTATQAPAAPAGSPTPAQQVQITQQAPKPAEQEAISSVSSGTQPAGAPTAPTAPTQTVEVAGTKRPDQEILDLIQQQLGTAVEQPTQAPTSPVTAPDQKIEVTGTALPPAARDVVSDVVSPTPAPAPDQRIDITGAKDQTYTVTGSPVTSEDVVSTVPPDQRIDITAPKDQTYTVTGTTPTAEDVISDVAPDQRIDITAPKDQTYTVTGTPPGVEDVISDVAPDQRIDITAPKDQTYTVTGTPVTEEDVISDVSTSVEPPAPPPPTAPTDEDKQGPTFPTDIFSYVNRRQTDVSPLLTQALSPGGVGRVGLAYSRPAGEIESEVTGKKRRNVWNEASLRLRDALGL